MNCRTSNEDDHASPPAYSPLRSTRSRSRSKQLPEVWARQLATGGTLPLKGGATLDVDRLCANLPS
jgi:hypothetical protein